MSNPEKLHAIEDYSQSKEAESKAMAEEEGMATGRDMSKVSLIISILSVVLVVVLFFGLNQNLDGLGKEVKVLSGLKGEVTTMKTQVGEIEGQVVGLTGSVDTMEQQLAQMPVAMQRAIITDAINDATNKLGYIGSQLDKTQADKLAKAMSLLQQVRTDINK
ncbi:MAG: hypothetical protein ACNI3A_04280 [Desulfovibrio sp.]|uniref:hypothetical protein n=1 Tax=Desulfovibrio sp. 7SRBS1 TaxID=3378064 RepID=UPI003B3DA05F